MQTLLKTVGWLTLALGVVGGALAAMAIPVLGSALALAFLSYAFGGAVASVLWFALAEVLQRQESNERAIRTVYTAVKSIRDFLNASQPAARNAPAVTAGSPGRPNKWGDED